jgi:putative solute:sodium symporter small subunit
MDVTARQTYWQRNLRLMAGLLVIWFVVSYGFGILLVEQMNDISFGDFELGFWFAQQGSIFTFVVLIGVYAWRMDALDEELGLAENSSNHDAGTPSAATDAATDVAAEPEEDS